MSVTKNRIQRNFEKYGTTVQVSYNGEKYESKAFISPLRYKNRVYIDNAYLEAGIADGGRYTYVGPPDLRLDKMDTSAVVTIDSEEYCIRKAEIYLSGDEPLYVWAILSKKDGGDSNGNFYG
ncbi:MAG: hypothetical protein PUC88_02405 [Clostridia bacterium]|nr:hypothetical protein [Clostridia bacterium]